MRLRSTVAGFHALHAPDVLQGWVYHGNLAALCLAPAGRPVVWGVRQSLHGNQDKLTTRAAIRASARWSERPAAIVYNSGAAKVQHEARGFSARCSSVIPNGFDLDAFRFDAAARASVRRTLAIGPEHVVIGHIARFHPSKDHAGFLRAASMVAHRNEAVRVVLAGYGIDSANRTLTDLIAQLGLAGRVLLLGPRNDVAELMSAVDVFCSSSSGMEGFPNVVAEAMCCEVACVTTDVGDARALVGDTGAIVPPSSSEALCRALDRFVRMTASERRTLGNAARQRIRERYSIDAIANQYERLYESLIRTRVASSCAA
jgi:glycosyltransferase involved in cell wall biosynthesis